MSRSIEPGDHVYISLGENTSKFVISEISLPLIYIHPESDPTSRSALTYVNGNWKVKGAEQVDYQIEFKPRVMPQAPPPKQEPEIDDDMATSICSDLILGESISPDSIESLKIYVDKANYPAFENTLMGIRRTCDPLLRRNLAALDPSLNIEMMSSQNLARWYQQRIQQPIPEPISTVEKRTPTTPISPVLPEPIPGLSEEDQRDLIAKTKGILRFKKRNQLKQQYENTVICRQRSVINQGSSYQVDPSLTGRRVRIPIDMWNQIFQQPLSENPAIREEFYRRTRYYPGRGDDPAIIHVMGQARVDQLLRETSRTGEQVFLEMEVFRKKSYALVSDFHTEQPDRPIIYVSPMLSMDFEKPFRRYAQVRDCVIDRIQTLSIQLLRDVGKPSVDDEVIKRELADRISRLGVPMVGDILVVNIDNVDYSYMIESIVTDHNVNAMAAAIPAVGSDVNVLFSVETKEDLKQKLELEIPGRIEQIEDRFI